MEERTRVLVIGVDPYRTGGPSAPAPVADALKASAARFADEGYAAEQCLVALDGSDDIEAVVTAALRAQAWDCVLIGGGLRKPDDLLLLFETVVNLVHEHAPGAQIAFNATLDDVVDAAARRVR